MIICALHSYKLPQQDNGLCTWRKSKYINLRPASDSKEQRKFASQLKNKKGNLIELTKHI